MEGGRSLRSFLSVMGVEIMKGGALKHWNTALHKAASQRLYIKKEVSGPLRVIRVPSNRQGPVWLSGSRLAVRVPSNRQGPVWLSTIRVPVKPSNRQTLLSGADR